MLVEKFMVPKLHSDKANQGGAVDKEIESQYK